MISTLQALKSCFWGWNFGPFYFMTNSFRDIRSPENRKCTELPQTELEHLIVKSTLYTLNTYPWAPNFGPFRSTISRFQDATWTRSAKIGNAPNDPKLNLNTWQSKEPCIHQILTPWGPNCGLFRSTTSGFEDIAHFIMPHWLPC